MGESGGDGIPQDIRLSVGARDLGLSSESRRPTALSPDGLARIRLGGLQGYMREDIPAARRHRCGDEVGIRSGLSRDQVGTKSSLSHYAGRSCDCNAATEQGDSHLTVEVAKEVPG